MLPQPTHFLVCHFACLLATFSSHRWTRCHPALDCLLGHDSRDVGDISAVFEVSALDTKSEEYSTSLQGGLTSDAICSILSGIMTTYVKRDHSISTHFESLRAMILPLQASTTTTTVAYAGVPLQMDTATKKTNGNNDDDDDHIESMVFSMRSRFDEAPASTPAFTDDETSTTSRTSEDSTIMVAEKPSSSDSEMQLASSSAEEVERLREELQVKTQELRIAKDLASRYQKERNECRKKLKQFQQLCTS